MTLLLGGGGHARDVLAVFRHLAEDCDEHEHLTVADDSLAEPQLLGGVNIFDGTIEQALVEFDEPFLVAVGYPESRRIVAGTAQAAGLVARSALIDRRAAVDSTATMAPGCVIFGNVWISPAVTISEHTHIGYGATVGHDSSLGKFVAVMPGANVGGEAHIGDSALVGSGAVILQGVSVGDGAIVGAGAVVTTNVESGATVVGIPAREVERKQ